MRRRPDVTLTQLRYFVKAATHSSMTKAADELHIAQSAVSAAISQLEQQIGSQLFIRHRARGLALTAAGEEMLRDTRALLAHLDEVLDNASGRVDQVHGTVRLACFVTLTPFVLPRLLSDLGTLHPDLEVEVIETSADAIRTVLRNGTAELALTYDLGLGAGVDAEYVGVAAPYVALPSEHRLAKRKSIRLTELADEPMVLLDLPDSRDYFEAMLAKAV
jgi:DNA-binding transcriptional LysR family regulator